MGDAHGGHAAGAGREFDRMAVQDQMGEFKNVEEFLERMHMRVEGTASGERSEAESGVHGADRSVDQAGACHANAVLEVFRRWPANPPLSPDGARLSPLDGSTRFSRAVRR